jgi:GTP cyclohydrolase I
MNKEIIEIAVKHILVEGLGLNIDSPNFKETPDRVARAFLELCKGLGEKDFRMRAFPTNYSGMVIVDPIKTVGMCPHHLLPVEYEIFVGYIPNKQAIGLSKIPRLVDWLAHKPVLQEDLTKEIVDELNTCLKAKGIICVVNGKHNCMRLRGIKQSEGTMTTSHFIGNFKNLDTRNEFISLIKK